MKRGEIIALIIAAIIGIIAFFYDTTILIAVKTLESPSLSVFLSIFKPLSVVLLFGLLFILLLWYEHKRKWIQPLILTLVSSVIVSFFIKFIVMRPRPFGLVEMIPFLNIIDYSFPSTHTIVIFSVLPILDREFPKLKYLWILMAVIIAFSRIYFQVHYLSDVMFGAIIGYLIGFLFVRKYEKKK